VLDRDLPRGSTGRRTPTRHSGSKKVAIAAIFSISSSHFPVSAKEKSVSGHTSARLSLPANFPFPVPEWTTTQAGSGIVNLAWALH